MLATLAFVSVPAPTGASSAPATLIARRFDDGLDSRLSAQHLEGALSNLGYGSSTHLNGRRAADAWGDGLSANVFAAFGHANAGIFQTDEGPSDDRDEILAAGNLWDLSGGNWWFWGNYLHYVDVDDMRLAIFAGCYTANVDPYLDSFGNVAEERGVDTVVGFSDLVYYPAFCTSCDYSGNYFWGRFSSYAQAGDTIAVALGKARNDLVAKEGDAGGWQSWKFDGALARPGDARLVPAGPGTPWNSRPFGIDPFDLLTLSISSARVTDVDGRSVLDVETDQGVSYRRDALSNDLLWLAAPASVAGDNANSITEEQARDRAVQFARANVSWFDPAAGDIHLSRPTREDGDLLLGFHWRRSIDGVRGPAIVEIEVDRRTGAIVGFSAARVSPKATAISISEADAVASARIAAGDPGAALVTATAEIWDRGRWSVVLDRAGDRLTPDLVKVIVDGRSGRVLSFTAT